MTPKAGRYALDTSVAIALLNGDSEVMARWGEVETAILPAPVLGELLYGARRSAMRDENEAAVRELAQDTELAACDAATCETYADIKAALARIGRPIPENDLWIAACALNAEATLLTRDAHFAAVETLPCEAW